MNKKDELNNLKKFNLNTSDVLCSGYAIKFNQANINGIIINKDSINTKNFEHMKISGAILDYEIDDNGVKIIKKFDLISVSI